MFSNCFQLSSVDLSSFTMENINNIAYMFNNTPKLEYINLTNAKPKQNIQIDNIFIGTSKNLVICTESEVLSQKIEPSSCGIISCSEDWRENQKKINVNTKQCIDNCSLESNTYDYLSKCVTNCPQNLYMDEYALKFVEICPNSTYILDRKCIKCHPDCESYTGLFNETNSNCTSCLSPDKYLENGNCVLNNEYIYTTNEIFISTLKEITTDFIADITTDIKKDIFTDIKTDMLMYTETVVYRKDKYINIASLYNTTNNTLIYNIIKESLIPLFDPENDFEIVNEAVDDFVFQITTSKNQLKALFNNSLNNYNLSIIDISNCEAILKDKYNININDSLILLKKRKNIE